MLRMVCGAVCERDDHDPGDEWICGLPPGHYDGGEGYHAALVVGGWHQWSVNDHETERNAVQTGSVVDLRALRLALIDRLAGAQWVNGPDQAYYQLRERSVLQVDALVPVIEKALLGQPLDG